MYSEEVCIVKNLGGNFCSGTVERTLLASVSQGRFDYVVGKIKKDLRKTRKDSREGIFLQGRE